MTALNILSFRVPNKHRGCAAFQMNWSDILAMNPPTPPSAGWTGWEGGRLDDTNTKAAMKLKGLISGRLPCLLDS